MKNYSRVCANIDLDAIVYNMDQMRANISKDTQMIAVIKTDGYGHGAVPIAHMLESKEYLWGFAVATLDEAMVLRRAQIQKPILVLGCIFPDQYKEMLLNQIRITIYTEDAAKAVSELAQELKETAHVHIKLDTGMSRLGFGITRESADAIQRISTLPNLHLEAIYTHFAKADETDKAFTQKQLKHYLFMTDRLQELGVKIDHQHTSNSAGIIDVPEANMDIVRAGISVYGLYPSEEVDKTHVVLKPALSLISHVAHVKWVEEGTPVSYGGTFTAPKRMRIATIPVGYGDGYPRSLSNKGYVLIHGKRAPILGRVCMDQFMVDVTDIERAAFGDVVTLVGTDGNESLPVEVLSAISDRFNYEFVCDLGKRIPRNYIRNGEITQQTDYFI